MNNLLNIDLLGFNQHDIAKGLNIPVIDDPQLAGAYNWQDVRFKPEIMDKIDIKFTPDVEMSHKSINHPSEYQDSENA